MKYLYIKKWDWGHIKPAVELDGHPREGRVYRATYNENSGVYEIYIFKDSTITLFKRDIPDGDVIELTRQNILDCEIREEDLDQMIKWMTPEQTIRQGMLSLKEAVNQQRREEIDAADRASKALMGLWILNDLKFEIVLEFVRRIIQGEVESVEDPASYLETHKNYGLGVNIAKALRALDRYAGDSRRTNENVEDLYEAMTACVTEVERKMVNGLID